MCYNGYATWQPWWKLLLRYVSIVLLWKGGSTWLIARIYCRTLNRDSIKATYQPWKWPSLNGILDSSNHVSCLLSELWFVEWSCIYVQVKVPTFLHITHWLALWRCNKSDLCNILYLLKLVSVAVLYNNGTFVVYWFVWRFFFNCVKW